MALIATAAQQSLAADGAVAYFSSKSCSFSLNADRAPQLKASVGWLLMILTLLLLALIDFASIASLEHAPLHMPEQTVVKCTQPENEQEPLLREAIENRFTVRRVEFLGNETTRDNILRRRIFLQEGELFTRRNLSRSIANVSKFRIIYPVKMSDVIVRLDTPNKLIDLAFCFRERHPRRSKRATQQFVAGERGIALFATNSIRRGLNGVRPRPVNSIVMRF